MRPSLMPGAVARRCCLEKAGNRSLISLLHHHWATSKGLRAVITPWESLDEPNQLALARAALERAIGIVAGRAETLANEMESGTVADQGGVEALRLFAALTRCASITADAIYSRIAHGQTGHA
jgi:hypothetical protein